MKTCVVEGHSIAYQRAGGGDPVLLLHGITTASFLWDEVLPALARDYDVIAPDLLGCGASAKPLDVPCSLSAHADRILALLDALGLERVHFVGHDLGGGIGQILGVRAPERMRSLTLVNSVGYDFWPVQPILAFRTPIIRQVLMSALDLGAFRLFLRTALHHTELLTPALLAKFTAPLSTPEGRKGFLHFARCLDNLDLVRIAAQLPELPMPVRILWGERDRFLSRAIPLKLHAEIPGSTLDWVQDSGHYLPIERPDALLGLLQEAFRAPRA